MHWIDHRKTAIKSAGLTRTEVVFSVVGVAIVAVLLTAFGLKAKRQNDLARCKDNLKNVVLALILWIDENELNDPPWHLNNQFVDARDPRRSESWFYMMWLSNQLKSPKLLVDPADKGARVAKTWDANPKSGFGAAKYRDRACSYAMALDVGLEFTNSPAVLLDRHLRGKSRPENCKYTGILSTGFETPLDLSWAPEVHGPVNGNMALLDGSADTYSESAMEHMLRANVDPVAWLNPATHVLFPKRPQSPTPEKH